MNHVFTSVNVRLDFDGYNIERIYGGTLTSRERERLEKDTKSSSMKYKIATLDPSYPYFLIDSETDWSLQVRIALLPMKHVLD